MCSRALRVVTTFFAPLPSESRFLSVVSPFPLFAPARSVAVVCDLRWMRTRARLARAYRGWDLRRTVRGAETIVCISQRTRDDLVAYLPSSADKTGVAWLGPGIVPADAFAPNHSGVVLLVGGAVHKRNEFAARMLADAKPAWLRSAEGVGVSTEVRAILEASLGADRCRWHDRISDDELLSVYRRAEYFVLFSREEGFGMPFVEALAAGCKVVAIDQPVTRELLGEAGCLIREDSGESVVLQFLNLRSVGAETRRRRAALYSWASFADAIELAIRASG